MAYCLRLYDRLGLKTLAPALTGTVWATELKGLLKRYVPSGEVFKSGPRKDQEKPGKWVPIQFSEAVTAREQEASIYAATDAVATSRLARVLEAQLDRAPGARKYYLEFEKPLVPVLLRMETKGIWVNRQRLDAAASVINERRETTEAALKEVFGSKVNLASGQQMGPILHAMGIVDGSLTPAGQLETGKPAILRAFSADRVEDLELLGTPVARTAATYLEWKQMGKLQSTYIDALNERLDAPGSDGRIHPRFNSAATVTNRLSSSNPNFQNLPSRSKVGAAIRKAIGPEPGNVWVGGDFSQLQLRIFGEMTGEPVFVNAYTTSDGIGDFHQYAATHLGRPRSIIKNFVFAVLFGAAAPKAALTAGIPEHQAAAFISQLRHEIPSLVEWQAQTQDLLAYNGGWVETMMGWRMVYPDFSQRNNRRHSAAVREASNGRIQGSEAGLVKAVLIEVYNQLRLLYPNWAMVLTVHDEVWAEGPEAEAEDVRQLMSDTVQRVARRWFSRVPIVFDVKKPLTDWSQAKD